MDEATTVLPVGVGTQSSSLPLFLRNEGRRVAVDLRLAWGSEVLLLLLRLPRPTLLVMGAGESLSSASESLACFMLVRRLRG